MKLVILFFLGVLAVGLLPAVLSEFPGVVLGIGLILLKLRYSRGA